jgi:hypothetical protein
MKLSAALILTGRKTPWAMVKEHNARSERCFGEIGAEFITAGMIEKRFTPEHAREAGYAKRKGEGLAFGSKAFNRSYTGIKFKRFKHMNPLQFKGETKDNIRSGMYLRTGKNFVQMIFPAAKKFNWRHPNSQIRMADEFRRITQVEAAEFSRVYERHYEADLNGAGGGIVERINF